MKPHPYVHHRAQMEIIALSNRLLARKIALVVMGHALAFASIVLPLVDGEARLAAAGCVIGSFLFVVWCGVRAIRIARKIQKLEEGLRR